MRYSLVFAGALATTASASPAFFKRYYVTEYAYVTDVVTVTAGGRPAYTPPAEVSVAAVPTSKAWGFGGWWNYKPSLPYQAPAPPAPTTPTVVYTPPPAPTTYQAPPPAPTTYQAPPPAPTTYQAPPPAPTTYQAPPPPKTYPTKPNPPKTPSYGGGAPAYSDIVVMHHNLHRANHSAPPLKWDKKLADTALAIAQSCRYEHNVDKNGGGYGQNIAAGAPPSNISSIITDHFYNDEAGWFEPFYGQATPSDMSDETFDKFGHFTQIVWKGTTKVGCATFDCTGSGHGPQGLDLVAPNVPPFFTVCNYGPPGNYLGEFSDNIEAPSGEPTENWSYGM